MSKGLENLAVLFWGFFVCIQCIQYDSLCAHNRTVETMIVSKLNNVAVCLHGHMVRDGNHTLLADFQPIVCCCSCYY